MRRAVQLFPTLTGGGALPATGPSRSTKAITLQRGSGRWYSDGKSGTGDEGVGRFWK